MTFSGGLRSPLGVGGGGGDAPLLYVIYPSLHPLYIERRRAPHPLPGGDSGLPNQPWVHEREEEQRQPKG